MTGSIRKRTVLPSSTKSPSLNSRLSSRPVTCGITLTGSFVTSRPENSLVGRSWVSRGFTTATVGGSGGGNCAGPLLQPVASIPARLRMVGKTECNRERCIDNSATQNGDLQYELVPIDSLPYKFAG